MRVLTGQRAKKTNERQRVCRSATASSCKACGGALTSESQALRLIQSQKKGFVGDTQASLGPPKLMDERGAVQLLFVTRNLISYSSSVAYSINPPLTVVSCQSLWTVYLWIFPPSSTLSQHLLASVGYTEQA